MRTERKSVDGPRRIAVGARSLTEESSRRRFQGRRGPAPRPCQRHKKPAARAECLAVRRLTSVPALVSYCQIETVSTDNFKQRKMLKYYLIGLLAVAAAADDTDRTGRQLFNTGRAQPSVQYYFIDKVIQNGPVADSGALPFPLFHRHRCNACFHLQINMNRSSQRQPHISPYTEVRF